MQIRLTLRNADEVDRDVLITAPPGAVWADVAAEVGSLLGTGPGDAQLWSGSVRLASSDRLGAPGLLTGDIVSPGPATEPEAVSASAPRLEVVGGPDAGLVMPLPRGVLTIGRARGNDLELRDPDVSRQHASVTVTAGGLSLRDLDSTNGTLLDEQLVDPDGSPLEPGQMVRVGDSLLCVSATDEPAAATRVDRASAARIVNRGPRLGRASADARWDPVEIPQPTSRATHPVQWLSALLPAILGGGLALATRNMMFLAFAALGPLALLGTAAGDRLHWRRRRRREAMSFGSRRAAADAQLHRVLADETALRRRAHPDPAAVVRTSTVPGCRLWERHRSDPDLLEVRLGLGERPSAAKARRADHLEPAGTLVHVPVIVDLRGGALGIAGPRAVVLASARWVIGQLATLHSPADLDLALLLSDDAAAGWTWTRWLPHLGDRVARTAPQRQALVEQLQRTVDSRSSTTGRDPAGWRGRWLVVLVDPTSALELAGGLARLLSSGPSVGVTAVCLEEEERRLPSGCAAIARVGGETGSRVSVHYADAADGPAGILDLVSTAWAESVSRALAPLADAGAEGGRQAVPTAARLLDLLALPEPSPQRLLDRWADAGDPSTPIGAAASGPIVLDLVRDGPHALIAGTTGSGKSELLQTVVAGLAATSPPEAVSFVLIDYKGGAAFAECAGLPHTAGLVTDLDSHLTRRALRSLEAELRRRERLLAAANCSDLAGYRSTESAGAEPLARLVIVVDEFAALADELPEFVAGLVSIAQRGRSLGVHLVLATQRPSGAVSPEIRANTTLRVALRVTDPAESIDVLGNALAASIDRERPGRAFVRTGSALVEMQTARIGCVSPAAPDDISLVALDGWGQLPKAEPVRGRTMSDLELLVAAARAAAAARGASLPRSPWLPPLPTHVRLERLDGNTPVHEVPLALADLPSEQDQRTASIDLDAGGSVLVVGAPRSGRSSVLRTLAVAAAARLDAGRLHLQVIDCAGGGLRPLGELPQCGTVATREGYGVADRLLHRLTAEVAHRQELLGELGVGSVAEARALGTPLPSLLLLVDGWEGFVAVAEEYDNGRGVELLLGLLRHAPSAGMTVVLTGDRSTLAGRVAGSAGTKFLLQLRDRTDYALAGLSARSIPTRMPPGRAVRAEDGAELHFALLGDDPCTAAQWQAARRVAALARPPANPSDGPVKIRELPRRVLARALPSADPPRLLLGLGGDTAEVVAIDVFAGPARFLVAGPPRSGCTSTLVLLCEQAVEHGFAVLVAAPGRSPLAAAARRFGVEVLTPQTDPAALQTTGSGPRLVLVDECAIFTDTAAGQALASLTASAQPQLAVVAASVSDDLALVHRGVGAEVRRARNGLLLQPQPGDGDLLGVRVPRRGAPLPPGRGVLVCDSATIRPDDGSALLPVQVALPRSG